VFIKNFLQKKEELKKKKEKKKEHTLVEMKARVIDLDFEQNSKY
jgi:hypothetical protein